MSLGCPDPGLCLPSYLAPCRLRPLGGAARTRAWTPAPAPEAVSRGPRAGAPPSGHVTRAVPLGCGACGQVEWAFAQLSWSVLKKAGSGLRAPRGSCLHQAGRAHGQRVPAWENRAEKPSRGADRRGLSCLVWFVGFVGCLCFSVVPWGLLGKCWKEQIPDLPIRV